MADLCPSPGTGAGFLSATLDHLDCQAQTIGAAGYQALASAGSPVSSALTSLLTIFIALLGLRMLLGRVASISDVTLSILKVGIVLLLATSWPAYRVIAYDLVLHGPAELFADIGQASALPGAEGGLVARLQSVDNGVLSLVAAGSGRLDITSTTNPADGLPSGQSPITDDTALGVARSAYVVGIIAVIGIVRLFGGLLLAVGPLFAGFLLFSGTRPFFMGWLRSLFATGLSSLAISLVLSVELAILEPWLGTVLAQRASRIATPFAPFELMALGVAFAIILLCVLVACAVLSFSSGFGSWVQSRVAQAYPLLGSARASDAPEVIPPTSNAEGGPSRAQVIAQSVAAYERREMDRSGNSSDWGGGGRMERTSENIRDAAEQIASIPLGQTYVRTASRVSAAATKRSATT
jgi:type IV secretion system protein VirB6